MNDSDWRKRSIATARSLLFVPALRHDRFAKAANSGADAIILDLEDSVPLDKKAAAREVIEREWRRLESLGVPVVIRMNSADSAEGRLDLVWMRDNAIDPAALMVPKADSAEALSGINKLLGDVPLLPIVESAAAYVALPALAGARSVVRLAIGHLDFMLDVGFEPDANQSQLASLRFAVAMATRTNRLAAAIDGPTPEFNDDPLLRIEVQRALSFGFGGKLCIHPRQVPLVHQAMLPSDREVAWAREVIAASAAAGDAAVQVNGQMVDVPVVMRARRTLERAGAA